MCFFFFRIYNEIEHWKLRTENYTLCAPYNRIWTFLSIFNVSNGLYVISHISYLIYQRKWSSLKKWLRAIVATSSFSHSMHSNGIDRFPNPIWQIKEAQMGHKITIFCKIPFKVRQWQWALNIQSVSLKVWYSKRVHHIGFGFRFHWNLWQMLCVQFYSVIIH